MTTVNEFARFYHSIGWQPLPSCEHKKQPALKAYREYRDAVRIPQEWLEKWWTPNIQLALGVRWYLMVVDVDGIKAWETWNNWHSRGRTVPPTWTVSTRNGCHHYFRIPPGVAAVPSRKVWLPPSGPEGHSEIQILGDRALAVAPPSRHVSDRDFVYTFMMGCDPETLPFPAFAPRWLLNLPAVSPERKRIKKYVRRSQNRRGGGISPTGEAAYESLADIPEHEKLALARAWGLRIDDAKLPNAKGWMPCHALDREDRTPSASFHPATGMFWQSGRRTICFAGLAVALGAYPDLPAAFRGLRVRGKGRGSWTDGTATAASTGTRPSASAACSSRSAGSACGGTSTATA